MTTPPAVLRHCNKCGRKTGHESSGLFRVNAQGRLLDIWLIYRCSHCASTWNAALYSRVNPQALDPALLKRFLENDPALARAYATDLALLRRLGGEPEPCSYTAEGPCFSFDEPVELHIRCGRGTDSKIAAILREKLGLSRKALGDLLDAGMLVSADGRDLRKARLAGDCVLLVLPQGTAGKA